MVGRYLDHKRFAQQDLFFITLALAARDGGYGGHCCVPYVPAPSTLQFG